MPSRFTAVKNAIRQISARDFTAARTAGLIAAKGAFLVLMALMIVTYAVSVSQSASPPPEPLPPYIYS